jgi:hypothetical protein
LPVLSPTSLAAFCRWRLRRLAALEEVADSCVINLVSEGRLQIERAGSWAKRKRCDVVGTLGQSLVTAGGVDLAGAIRPLLS